LTQRNLHATAPRNVVVIRPTTPSEVRQHADRAQAIAAVAVRPNLSDYERICAQFSWQAAHRWLDGLSGTGGLNIARLPMRSPMPSLPPSRERGNRWSN
jgi:hypothetical protein